MPAFWNICHRIPKDSTIADTTGQPRHFFCIYIPILIDVNVPRHPDPGPVFTHPGLTHEDTRTLQALATIDHLADELPKTLSRPMQQSVATHMQEFGKKLGDGFELSRQTAKG